MKNNILNEIIYDCIVQSNVNGVAIFKYDKLAFITKLVNMDDETFNDFMNNLSKTIHNNDTTSGLYAMDSDPRELLEKFWQISSDACPLEITAAEKQIVAFGDFVDNLCFRIDN